MSKRRTITGGDATMTKWVKRLGIVGLLGALAGCGTPPAPTLSVRMPPAYPGIAATSLQPISPELEGYVGRLALTPTGTIRAEAFWSNVPGALTMISWQPSSGAVRQTAYDAASASALGIKGQTAVEHKSAGLDEFSDVSGQQTLSVHGLLTPAAMAVSASRVYAALPMGHQRWEMAVTYGQQVSLYPLPSITGQVVAMQPAPGDGVWLAEDHPNVVMLWQKGRVLTQTSADGPIVALSSPQFSSSTPQVLALIAGPGAFPQTANQVMKIGAHDTSVTIIPSSWAVPGNSQLFAGGVSRLAWVTPHEAVVTLWDAGVNQVAIGRVNLARDVLDVVPSSNFSPVLLYGQPPIFPVISTPSGVIVVGQGYGLAFYLPSADAWTKFIKTPAPA